MTEPSTPPGAHGGDPPRRRRHRRRRSSSWRAWLRREQRWLWLYGAALVGMGLVYSALKLFPIE